MRTLNKSNYGPAGMVITVKWVAGVYIPQTGASSLNRRALENRADKSFLDLLSMFNAQGQNASSVKGTTYAPAAFAEHPKAAGIGKKHFAAAMQRHLAAGRIKIETFGPPSTTISAGHRGADRSVRWIAPTNFPPPFRLPSTGVCSPPPITPCGGTPPLWWKRGPRKGMAKGAATRQPSDNTSVCEAVD